MMTQEEIIGMIERNMNNNPNPMIDHETAMKALRSISKHADRKNIPWALIGGGAMVFYGSPPLVTPEWLVILKYIASRFRDQQDAVFLLKKKGLVDRKLIRRKVTETIGPAGWGVFAVGLKRWYDPADGKITTEKEDYEADRL